MPVRGMTTRKARRAWGFIPEACDDLLCALAMLPEPVFECPRQFCLNGVHGTASGARPPLRNFL
jgi:hypothetical protein